MTGNKLERLGIVDPKWGSGKKLFMALYFFAIVFPVAVLSYYVPCLIVNIISMVRHSK